MPNQPSQAKPGCALPNPAELSQSLLSPAQPSHDGTKSVELSRQSSRNMTYPVQPSLAQRVDFSRTKPSQIQ